MGRRDVVIIGSGFGGAVMASRLGAHAIRDKVGSSNVLVIEKGNDPTGKFDVSSGGSSLNAQGNRFRQTLAPENVANVAEIFTDRTGIFRRDIPSMNVIAGKGIGGGSNVYDGVSLRAPTEAFEQVRGGRRTWPSFYSRASLNSYYATVEDKLSVHRLSWTDEKVPHWQLATKRDFVFAEGCRRIGATALPLKLADDRDANEGWWNQGQRFEGRQGLFKNYLRDALSTGVEFWSDCEVETIEPLAGGGYVIIGTDRRSGGSRRFEVECRIAIVAAGSIASTGLLLRSAKNFKGDRSLDPAHVLGKNLSSNGDYGVTGVVGKDFEFDVEGHKGKPMSSFCPSFFPSQKFILIPFYAAPLYLTLGQPSTLLRAALPEALGRGSTGVARGADGAIERDWGLPYKQRLKQFGSRMLTMGCLALDDSEGEIILGRDDVGCEVRWAKTSPETEKRWNAAIDTMRKIYQSLGGEMYLDSYRKEGTVNTAHPLGGCGMVARGSEESGVTDELGESWNNRNLFVVDGALIPTALGVNPSLTIAAVAESIADRLLRGVGTDSFADRLK
ncbi:MAG: hypothetical protein NVS3B20_04640 [Polyangiales bacterium]